MSLNLPRRTLLGGLAGAAVTASSAAAGKAIKAPMPITQIPVWNGFPPGGIPVGLAEQEIPRSPNGPKDDTAFLHVTAPSLMHCRPTRPNGAAMLLVPGGSYMRVAIGRGGAELLRGFADRGYHAFLLKYRLPGDLWKGGPDAPLQDAQRALRLIRSLAAAERFDARRIGIWGGSAGGHLAARLSNSTAPVYDAVDAVDRQPLGVRATILLYPVNLMTGAYVHATSRQQLLGNRTDAEASVYAAQDSVSATSPPTFLAHALDDDVVPVENSLSYFSALRAAGVATELHVQEDGGHGFGLSRADGSPWQWRGLAEEFLRRHGV